MPAAAIAARRWTVCCLENRLAARQQGSGMEIIRTGKAREREEKKMKLITGKGKERERKRKGKGKGNN